MVIVWPSHGQEFLVSFLFSYFYLALRRIRYLPSPPPILLKSNLIQPVGFREGDWEKTADGPPLPPTSDATYPQNVNHPLSSNNYRLRSAEEEPISQS